MSDTKKYIGFDLGAESGRCIVGELKQDHLALTEVHRFSTPFINYGDRYFWDIWAIYLEVEKGLSQAARTFGEKFDGISVDSWGVDYVLLDADNRVLGYPYHYRDSRTDGMIEKSFTIFPKEKNYRITGCQFAQYNTLFQLLAESEQKSSLLDIAQTILMVPSFLLYLLSGVKKSDYTIVSTTHLADPRTRNWSWKLIKAFGFPKKIFPEVVEPGTILGNLLPGIARKTGVSEKTPVIAGAGHDTAAAVAAVPATAIENNWAYLSSGTWSLMGMELSKPVMTEHSMAYNFTNEGGVAGTIRFLKNIMGLWPVQECRRYWLEQGKEYSYSELVKLAHEAGAAASWVNIDASEFLKPGDMPIKILQFLKATHQKHRENAAWLIRCVLESLAFKYRLTIQQLEQVTGQKIKKLHAVGGGIQNELLNQLTADALDCEVIAGPVEGTIIGNIGIQAIATGKLKDITTLREIVAASFELKSYKPSQSDYWNRHAPAYQALLRM